MLVAIISLYPSAVTSVVAVMVVVTAFSIDISEGVSKTYVGHFGDHPTDWTHGDILGSKVKEQGQGGVVMVWIARYSPTPALTMSKGC